MPGRPLLAPRVHPHGPQKAQQVSMGHGSGLMKCGGFCPYSWHLDILKDHIAERERRHRRQWLFLEDTTLGM